MIVPWRIYAKIYIFKIACKSDLIFKLHMKQQEELLKQSNDEKLTILLKHKE